MRAGLARRGNIKQTLTTPRWTSFGSGWAALATALLLLVPPAHAATPETSCFNASQANADYEAYGPTDVNAQTGDGRLTVNENSAGTLTVFKYPNPSYYNQIKYFALRRNRRGVAQAQYPNEGSFAGLLYRVGARTRFAWLRDWRSSQRYASPDTSVPVTVYRAPGRLGLTVQDTDLVVPGTSTFVRRYRVTRRPGSAVRSVRLVYFENFNPVATRTTYLPLDDWCFSQLSDQSAAYERPSHAILNWWTGTDQASGRPASAAVAIAFAGADSRHQVGGDGYDSAALAGQPADPFNEVSRPPHRLGGATSARGQTTGALETPLRFDRRGRASARVLISAGSTPAGALSALRLARRASFARELRSEARYWRGWLARTWLPDTPDRRVVDVAKRTLISVRLAIDPASGAIVASANTQGPYGEDWIRDGSFINQLLDLNGYAGVVTRHNLFYARIQTSPTNPSPIRPSGNWAMASYGDGIDGAPIPWEIDETGLGIWALQSHARHLTGAARRRYLRSVFPAIARAAGFLTTCMDPRNGLQCPANEDDNFTPSQSLHGAETVDLGLRSALAAASALGKSEPAWRVRLKQLDAAIRDLYNPRKHAYGEGDASGNAYNVSYGDGGWLLWPVEFRPFADPTMVGEARAVRAAMDASLRSAHGEYEAKALLGLSYAWSRPTPAQSRELHHVLHHMAAALTTPTGLFGEAWERFAGHPRPVEDMPHVWEHTLFYLAALRIDGRRRYRFARGG